jgi:two-component system sensor histidine kinase GlrK
MRITSKVILGYGLMIVIIIALYVYQTSLMNEMLEQQRQLTDAYSGSSMIARRVFWNSKDMVEFSDKYLATGDRFYLDKVLALRIEVDDDLHNVLKATLFAGPLAEKAGIVVSGWNRCSAVVEQLDQFLEEEEASKQINASCSDAWASLYDLFEAADNYRRKTEGETRQAAERLTSVSRIALSVALILSVGVTLFVFRSISVSLKEMIGGAQRIARGDFAVKLRQDRGDELSDLAVALNRMTRRLRELDRLKRDFVSHVSHDLRAPLASVEETTRLLLDEFSDGLDETQRRLLELSLSSSHRLSRLIGNLLDLSRIEAGVIGYDFQDLDLKQTVGECVENLQGLFLDKQLKVEVRPGPVPCFVRADRVRLGRVVENLLSNAIEFSPAKGTIEVGIERVNRSLQDATGFEAAADGPLCLISVLDQGPGIPPFERERVFDQFYTTGRQDSNLKKGGGTGLGLTIARRIVDAHDGQIWVESAPSGQGSRFCILLRSEAHQGPAVEELAPQAQG